MSFNIKSALILDGVGEDCTEILKAHGIQTVCRPKLTYEELIQEVPIQDDLDHRPLTQKHQALIVRSATQVTSAVLAAGTNLKVVARAGAGVDNIDLKAAKEKNIMVINAPGANAISACELTCALMLTSARKIAPAAQSMKESRWDRKLYGGSELYGKVLGVLGLGRVGREVAVRMNAFGMKILCYEPYMTTEQCAQYHAKKVELKDIWAAADYITLHVPSTEETKNMINASVLRQCKKGVVLVNVARGALIHDKDLLTALNEGHIGGAVLDVFREEPPKDKDTLALIQHPNVVATPHLGASTTEAQQRVGEEIAKQLVNLNKPKTFPEMPLSAC